METKSTFQNIASLVLKILLTFISAVVTIAIMWILFSDANTDKIIHYSDQFYLNGNELLLTGFITGIIVSIIITKINMFNNYKQIRAKMAVNATLKKDSKTRAR